MKTHARYLVLLGALAALVAVALLLAAPSAVGGSTTASLPPEPESQPADTSPPNRVEQSEPVIFPPDLGWPEYAQREITVDPEPPIPGQPTEVCAWVVNTTGTTQTVTLDFGVANFGIGLPFTPIGARTIEVPPFSKVKACVVWIPREPGHWCLQVLLKQGEQWPILRSQRNIDIWEALKPDVPALTVFPVQNTTGLRTDIQLVPTHTMPGWQAFLDPPLLSNMGVNETRQVTLTVVPPRTGLLGSREPIVDVEARSAGGQGPVIGGFRKLDMPPVPLHRLKDPPYAETEISVNPYPTLPGEPTKICVDLRNLSNVTQTVKVGFMVADFGIGLPFEGIGGQEVEIPPFGHTRACVTWIPSHPGHFCVQVNLDDPQGYYAHQWSQRNLDVGEILSPGVQSAFVFGVGNTPGPTNSDPITADIFLTVTQYLPGWKISLPEVLSAVAPGDVRQVTMLVTPPAGVTMPEDGALVADVEAYLNNPPPQGTLLGGFRKIFHPPIPIHVPQEPPYSESEIGIFPYPPRAGEPVKICTELRNPTSVTQTVHVEFGVVNFGIGLPFTPIDLQEVQIPPLGKVKVCTQWVPSIAGHFCAQIIIRQEGYQDVVSQRNMDVAEYLRPGITDQYAFPVGNPFDKPITVSLGLVLHLPGWQADLSNVMFGLAQHEQRVVTLTVTPPADLTNLGDETPVLDVEAYYRDDTHEWTLLGGFRKLFRPPIPIHHPEDPPYAEREISIQPYPPRAGEPTEICVELRNPTDYEQTVWVEFAWADFGIGLPWHPFHGQLVTLPPHSLVKKCTTWVPPFAGHFCAQVSLIDPAQPQRYPVVRSQRNMDVGEILIPGQPSTLTFPVHNSTQDTVTVMLGLVPHLEWDVSLSQDVLPNMGPGATRPVTLTVTRPLDAPEPEPGQPVVDVEGYIGGQLIGGLRKLYYPPVPIHRPGDPVYAESEISINPYPPREREPTGICVDVRNPTDAPQTITVTFAVANFGIGLPFHDIVRPIVVTLPPNSIKRVCVTWVPPFGGHFCVQVTLQIAGHDPVRSQRNMDVGEILIPGEPSHRQFLVGNPTDDVVTITLGMVPHLDGWQVQLSQDVLPNMPAHETRVVTLTVIPPLGMPEPEVGAPVVDVEGFIGRKLIGGFRKLFHPPVSVHVPKDPPYAESEIFIDPYPTREGMPTLLGAVIYNPTNQPQTVTVTFGVAHFGIGLPFTTTGILTPTMAIQVPPNGAARAKTIWRPPFSGHFCVQVTLQSAGHEPVRSQRNIDVGEPLHLGEPHARRFVIGNPMTEAVTITLALVNHRPGWTTELTPGVLANMRPGMTRTVVLTVTPPLPPVGPDRERELLSLADEQPVVDVEAYVNGELIGGIRKIAKPPIPLHKPQDRPYAETEIGVSPYPLVAGKPATITTDIVNTSETTQTIRVLFGVANFGFGIPFTTTDIVPTSTMVTLGPGISQTVSAVWTRPPSGHWCIQTLLQDPDNQYPEQRSQRNVDVEQRSFKPCEPFTKDFRLENSTDVAITVTIGASAINLPQGWTYSTNVTETVMEPHTFITVTITITPPCGLAAMSPLSALATMGTGGASGPPTIDVEGYNKLSGDLLGGVEVQLEGPLLNMIYLPIVLKQR
jgi:hypothetical protein